MAQGAVYGVFLVIVTAVLSVTADTRIQGCDGNMTVVEGSSRSFYCYGSAVPTGAYRWTLVTESGSTFRLATCYHPNNCSKTSIAETTFPGLMALQPSADNTGIWVRLIPQFSGRLTCSQTLDSNTVQSTSCGINIVRIKARGSCGVQEDSSNYCYCDTASLSPSTVTWSLTNDAGVTLHLSTCDDVNSCSPSQHVNVDVDRHRSSSHVRFTSTQRDKSGQLSCSFTYRGVTDTDSTPLTVYRLPTVENCSVGIVPFNWSFLLSCDVSRVFSSKGHYQFQIRELFQLTNASAQVTNDPKSFGDALTAYTDDSNGREYYRGGLVHSWPLLSVPRRRADFFIWVFSVTASTTKTVYSGLTVSPPDAPTHNCSEASCTRDTNLTPCVCSTPYLGTPAGRLLWLQGDTVLATGDHGVNHLVLPHYAVSTTKDWVMVTCQLDWVTPRTVSVVLDTKCPSETSTDSGQTTDQHNPATWIAVGAGTVLAVVIVVAIVVFIMYRRGRLSACPCWDRVYDSPKPQHGDSSHDPDHHLYEVVTESVGHRPMARGEHHM